MTDSDAPTPREATPVDGLREALQDLPFSRQWPTQKPPGEWYVRVEDAISFMVEERAREAQAGSRSARSSTALQAAASTAAAGEGATGRVGMTGDMGGGGMPEDEPWESLVADLVMVSGLYTTPDGSLALQRTVARHRSRIEAAIVSRATSETPRETPLASAGIDVELLARALSARYHNPYAKTMATEIAAEYAAILAAARGSE